MLGSHRVAAMRHRIGKWKTRSEISQHRISAYLQASAKLNPAQRQPPNPSSIAIVVSCYEHAPFLETMFASLTNQTHRPDEVVLIDDQSPDGRPTSWSFRPYSKAGVCPSSRRYRSDCRSPVRTSPACR